MAAKSRLTIPLIFLQDFNALIHYMEEFPPSKFLECASDFHLLLFLATTDMLPLKVSLVMQVK